MQVRRCVFLVNAPVAILASPHRRCHLAQSKGLRDPEIRSLESEIQQKKKTHKKKFRNPTKDWNPESKFH